MFVRKEKDGVDHRRLLVGCRWSLMSVGKVFRTRVFLDCHFCLVVGVVRDVEDMVLESSVLVEASAGRNRKSCGLVVEDVR